MQSRRLSLSLSSTISHPKHPSFSYPSSLISVLLSTMVLSITKGCPAARTACCGGPRTGVASGPRRVAALQRREVVARWATRLQELEVEDSREAKIRLIAEAIGATPEAVASAVAIRPGLLLVSPQTYKQRIHKISMQYGVALAAAAALAVQNPGLLFEP